jgi:hypothetical protein
MDWIHFSSSRAPGPSARLEAAPAPGPMSLSHCPLCMALAVLSTVRGLSLALLFWRLVAPAPKNPANHTALLAAAAVLP